MKSSSYKMIYCYNFEARWIFKRGKSSVRAVAQHRVGINLIQSAMVMFNQIKLLFRNDLR